jgi:mono/diheme cytochrome c family protein
MKIYGIFILSVGLGVSSATLNSGALTCAWAQESSQYATSKITHSGRIISGQQLYINLCATCHGIHGKGDGPTADSLKVKPIDLTTLAKNNGGQFPYERALAYVNGTVPESAHGSRSMPVWGLVLMNPNNATTAAIGGPAATHKGAESWLRLIVNYIAPIQEK